MTEQERLCESIVDIVFRWQEGSNLKTGKRIESKEERNNCLFALFKEALPELAEAEEAGYDTLDRFIEQGGMTPDMLEQEGYVKLADIRQAIAIEYKKAIEESEAHPFQVRNLDYEHRLLWKGHASAYSEMLSYLDTQVGGK